MPLPFPVPSSTRLRGWMALPLLALAIAGCTTPDRAATTGSIVPSDVRERHPIVLANGQRKLDLFVNGRGLDPRQREDVAAFAAEFRRFGQTGMAVQVPVGGTPAALTQRSVSAIRSALAASGVGAHAISLGRYEVADPSLAAPIRLTFARLESKVGSTCGLWPTDLGVSDFADNNMNRPYWNLGCATQANIAAQVADPLDLVRGRVETRADTIRRTNNFDKLRKGTDPSVPWRQDGQTSSKSAIQ